MIYYSQAKGRYEMRRWLNDNVNYFSDGGFLDDGTQISIYEIYE